MNRESTEHLSSLMDGEVSQETGRFLVRRLGADVELRQTWARYHLIRDCLRHQDGQFAQNDLSSRVQHALSDEPVVSVRFHLGKTGWLRPAAGVAIAASVALIAILTVSQGIPTDPTAPDTEMALTPVAEPFTSPNMSRMTPASQPVNLAGSAAPGRQRMNAYLLRHFQVAEEAGGGRGFVSFVPIVGTQSTATARAGSGDEEGEKEVETGPR